MRKDLIDPVSSKFNIPVSATDIATMKSTVEGLFTGVGFAYSGSEFDYVVEVIGPRQAFTRAVNYLFPKDKTGIVIQHSQFGPDTL